MDSLSTLDQLLTLCQKRLPPGLVVPEAVTALLHIGQQLPILFADCLGFETYLEPSRPTAGLYMCVAPQSPGWQFLVAPDSVSSPGLLAQPVWQRIRKLCRAMDGLEGETSDWITGLWLEFDVDSAQSVIPDIFLSPNRQRPDTQQVQTLAELAIEKLQEMKLSSVTPTLTTYLERLPSGSAVIHLGVLLGRAQRGVRLVIRFPKQVDALYTYLARVDWPGAVGDLQTATAWMAGMADSYNLQIDLAETLAPRISIECCLAGQAIWGMDQSRWSALLDAFAAQGLCPSARREALLTFPGGTHEMLCLWLVLLRQLSHAKVIYQPGHFVQAKAYFQYQPLWGA